MLWTPYLQYISSNYNAHVVGLLFQTPLRITSLSRRAPTPFPQGSPLQFGLAVASACRIVSPSADVARPRVRRRRRVLRGRRALHQHSCSAKLHFSVVMRRAASDGVADWPTRVLIPAALAAIPRRLAALAQRRAAARGKARRWPRDALRMRNREPECPERTTSRSATASCSREALVSTSSRGFPSALRRCLCDAQNGERWSRSLRRGEWQRRTLG